MLPFTSGLAKGFTSQIHEKYNEAIPTCFPPSNPIQLQLNTLSHLMLEFIHVHASWCPGLAPRYYAYAAELILKQAVLVF